MKLVGLISDTHIPSKAKAIPSEVFEIFNGVNQITKPIVVADEDTSVYDHIVVEFQVG